MFMQYVTIILYYAMLCYAIVYSALLYSTKLYYTILYYTIGQKHRPPAIQRRRPQDDGDDAHPSDVLARGGLHALAPPCRDPVQDPGHHVRGHIYINGKHNNAYVLVFV